MFPYFLLTLLPILVWMIKSNFGFRLGDRVVKINRNAEIGCFMLVFLLLLAMRGLECGVDTKQYIRLFDEYRSLSFSRIFGIDSLEVGYRLLNRFIGIFTSDPQVLLIVTAIMCVIPLWYFYKRESEHTFLTIALFLAVAPFNMYFSGIRQAIAMAFVVPAWYLARKKKLFWFIVIVLLAMQFHTSAFIIAAIYPLYHARITTKWLWATIPAIGAVYIFNKPIFNFLLQFLWEDYGEMTDIDATAVLVLLVIFAIYSYVIADEQQLDQDTIGLRNILLLMVAIQCFAPIHPLSMRMNYYFLILLPILIPKIANRSKLMFAKVAKLSVVIMVAYFIFYFYLRAFTGADSLGIYPYVPFWK